MSKPPILVVPERQAVLSDELSEHYEVHRYWQIKDKDAFLAGPGQTIRVAVVGGPYVPPTDFLDGMPNLGLIACVSVGYEGVKVDWCREHGVAVTTGRGANAGDVADHALGLILSGWRGLAAGEALLRSGTWVVDGKPRSHSIKGRTVGIVGMGSIGEALVRRLAPLEVQLAWWGPNPKPELSLPRAESLLVLADQSDVLVMAGRADETTRGLISAEVIDRLGPEALFVNIARGLVVDEPALIDALKAGRLGGAALDVFEREPTDPARWQGVPNTVLTPHMAGSTFESTKALWSLAKDNIARFFDGRPLSTPLFG